MKTETRCTRLNEFIRVTWDHIVLSLDMDGIPYRVRIVAPVDERSMAIQACDDEGRMHFFLRPWGQPFTCQFVQGEKP